ncbi:MAG: hypothetical protein WDO15_04435 [Bacteroidota bacterium]
MKVTKYFSLGLLIAAAVIYAPNASAQEHPAVPAETNAKSPVTLDDLGAGR